MIGAALFVVVLFIWLMVLMAIILPMIATRTNEGQIMMKLSDLYEFGIGLAMIAGITWFVITAGAIVYSLQ